MSIVNLIKTSLYSIKAHKLRVFLTMIGIIIGISSTVAIKSIGDGLSEYITSSMESSNSNKYEVYFEYENDTMNSEMIEPFDENDIDDIKNIEGVTDVSAATASGSTEAGYGEARFFSNSTQIFYMGYENMKPEVQSGRWFYDGENEEKTIVINEDTAKTLFNNVDDAIGKGITINGDIYEVIGVTKKSDNFFEYINSLYCFISKYNMDSLNKDDTISSIYFYVDPSYDTETAFDDIKKILSKNHSGIDGSYEVYDPSQQLQLLTTIVSAITTFVTAITGIALFVGGVGVMNIMYVSVTERKREIGIRRAIGAKPITILFQFLFEAIIVTFTGGLIGILLGYLLGKGIGSFIPIEGFKAVMTTKTFLSSSIISVLVGIVFGIIPARNASKLDPIKAIYQ
ncbi:putative ABC transporter [Clostridium bornimense]|uniref:Putative ABC transporter n=1 Tax=Clostridium bornimense TaxID=1216932 RepID=W6RSN3_9CLOT|nr:ABC transporter permease [Clostridium bornimense]CDM67611.1 putative ABC transporter [Clostridium bornimense]